MVTGCVWLIPAKTLSATLTVLISIFGVIVLEMARLLTSRRLGPFVDANTTFSSSFELDFLYLKQSPAALRKMGSGLEV